MSNALAVPAVTGALVALVQAAVDTVGLTPHPVVRAADLEDFGSDHRVGVHLYRVSRSEFVANEVLPVRGSDGRLRARPTVALELHYLLVFRDAEQLMAQLMLAAAAVAVEANPEVSLELLQRAVAVDAELAGHDLGDAPARVRWTADALSVDELTKLWALYPAASFALTLAVRAGPVLVEAAAEPGVVLPVLAVGLGARPLPTLRLDGVGGPDGAGAPVRAAEPMPPLSLYGAGFRAATGETVVALLDGAEVTSTGGDDGRLVVPAAGLRPGAHRVQVRKDGPPLDPAVSATPTSVVSEVRVVLVVPTLVSASTAAQRVTATVVPAVSATDRVRLLLDPVAGGASHGVPADLGAAATDEPEFDVGDVPAGTYRLTLEVGGARSIPALGVAGHYEHVEVTL